MNNDFYFAIKDAEGFYYCGLNRWNKQLRKAMLYRFFSYAIEARDDIRWIERETKIVRVRIEEIDEFNPDWEV